MKQCKTLILMLVLFVHQLAAQEIPVNPVLLKEAWPSSWITCPGVPQRDYGVYHFRKSFDLNTKPERFIVHVSADNRYRLFVNGKAVLSGPARGDKFNWYFESIDIAQYLKSGKNVIAAKVWNMGVHAAVAQISDQTAFVLQGDTQAEAMVNSNGSYKVMVNQSYTPVSLDNGPRLEAYMVIGPGDKVDGSKYPWGWEQLDYDDSKWLGAAGIAHPVTSGYGTDNIWTLSPRNIPLMEERLDRIAVVRRADVSIGKEFLKGKAPLRIAPHSKVSILLDQSFNTVAYPELLVSAGKGSSIKLTYTEALLDDKKQKGNRNDITGKTVIGNYDIFEPDGGTDRLFRPLWFRTYRYIQVDVETQNEGLILSDIYGKYTSYPFEQRATFSSNDPSLKALWDVSWRTARLCAGETYFDCPYYEQLQYEGDTRIQSLISLYVAGDDRLMRKAMLDFLNSRVPEGLTQGRYPSNRVQVIPPYSLFWVSMVHDYWMHRRDDEFVKGFMTGIKGVLDWYEHRIDAQKNMLGPMKWWNFVDYTEAFKNTGVPDGAEDGNSSIITFQYIYTLQQAAELCEYFGQTAEAKHYKELAERLSLATYQLCFDESRNALGDTPEKKKFSQHAGILALLANAIPKEKEAKVMETLLHDKTLGPATFYFRFYLIQAMKKVGMGDLYYSELKPWRDMLKIGLTTFAEKPEPARSDCHAWSASPSYDFLATICGISPALPGFKALQIKPAFGELNAVVATMPHPDGEIQLNLKRKGKHGLQGTVTLPEKLKGKFIWEGQELVLKGGVQQINFAAK